MGLDDSEQLWSRGEKRGKWFCKGEEGTLRDLGTTEIVREMRLQIVECRSLV